MFKYQITTFLNNEIVSEYHGCFDIEFDENYNDLWFYDYRGKFQHVRHKKFDAILIKDEVKDD